MAQAAPVEATSLSARLADSPAYGYRGDAGIPAFDDTKALIVYDGVCVLCSRAMRRIAAGDPSGRIQFASAQSSLGQALFRRYGLDPTAFETVLLLDHGRAFGKMDVAVEIARLLGGPWRLFHIFRCLPRRAQDAAYDVVAKNRYRLFGRTEQCMRPDPNWRSRVIDHPAARANEE